MGYKQLPPLIANSRGSDARSQRAKVPSFTMFYHVLSKIKLSFGASWQCLPGLLGYIWDLI